jgi:transmembrane sensor
MERSPIVREQIAAEAAQWLLAFQRNSGDRPESTEFSDWLLRSPLHIEEFLSVSAAWFCMQLPDAGEYTTAALIEAAKRDATPSNIFSLPGSQAARPVSLHKPAARRGRYLVAAAAAVMALVVGGSVWVLREGWPSGTRFATALGEQWSVALSDGSIMFLNTDSEVRVRWTAHERHIDLLRGEARFQVAKNRARPFIVSTPDASVRAVGTIFDVRAEPTRTQVAVIEGLVQVDALSITADTGGRQARAKGTVSPAPASRMQLSAGQVAAVSSAGIRPNEGASIKSIMAWMDRQLVFDDQPLSEVIAEFNRYRSVPIVLDDEQLATLKISGIFDASDPESLVAYLLRYEAVNVIHPNDGTLHLVGKRPGQ